MYVYKMHTDKSVWQKIEILGMNCSRFQLLNLSVVMNLLNYMEKETDFLPWISAQIALQDLTPGDIKPEIKVLMVTLLAQLQLWFYYLKNMDNNFLNFFFWGEGGEPIPNQVKVIFF